MVEFPEIKRAIKGNLIRKGQHSFECYDVDDIEEERRSRAAFEKLCAFLLGEALIALPELWAKEQIFQVSKKLLEQAEVDSK